MTHNLQIVSLHSTFDDLQEKHGDKSLNSIYGAGCITRPEVMFVFMNPTARNIAAVKIWKGIRAPWLGIKNIWKMFFALDLIDTGIHQEILSMSPVEWSEEFSLDLYKNVAKNKIYITNLAKCTQSDAKHLDDKVFHQYLDHLIEEIDSIKPKYIVTFGSQVSSIILDEKIKISADNSSKTIKIKEKNYPVVPVHYPVGHGQRNVHKSIESIKKILAK